MKKVVKFESKPKPKKKGVKVKTAIKAGDWRDDWVEEQRKAREEANFYS